MNAPAANSFSRRQFLAATGAALGAATIAKPLAWAAKPAKRPRVAAIFTEFTHRSHAHVILENFLEPYLFNGKKTDPGCDVVSMYAHQTPGNEMTPAISKQYGIPVFKTIDEALCVGGKEMDVDAVLSIGEHGQYPVNEFAQMQYPRKEFFDQIVAVMKRSQRFVPLFNDKHLSYRWDWAKEMYDVTQENGIPFMAGSSVPMAQRVPPLEIPMGVEFQDAVAIHGGGLESYDFHGLEVLQSMVEARKGAETGVAEVEFLEWDGLKKAAEQGRWSMEVALEAMAPTFGKRPESLDHLPGQEKTAPHGILVTYRDGFRAAMLAVPAANRWNFGCRFKGDPKIHATSYNVGPWVNRNLFKALSHAIQHMFITREPAYPVERTLLTTGILDAAMHSRHEKRALETPQLDVRYEPKDFRAFREMGESWKILTDDIPEPEGIGPVKVDG